jgi:hypothetical protein
MNNEEISVFTSYIRSIPANHHSGIFLDPCAEQEQAINDKLPEVVGKSETYEMKVEKDNIVILEDFIKTLGDRAIKYIRPLQIRTLCYTIANKYHLFPSFLNIPDINGSLEVGIAVGSDPSLPDAEKLPLYKYVPDYSTSAFATATVVYNMFANDDDYRDWYTLCAFSAVYYGFVSEEDGDSYISSVSVSIPEEIVNLITNASKTEGIKKALAAIIAGKITWWVTNNERGDDKMSGYAKKIADLYFSKPTINPRATMKFMDTVSRWCSTRRVLSMLGVRNIHETKPLLPINCRHAILNFSDQEFSSVKSCPAGTQRHVLAYKISQRLMGNIIGRYSTIAVELPNIAVAYSMIESDPVMYHTSALYLTKELYENPRFSDSSANKWLGRLTTFMKIFMPSSPICASPHIKQKINGRDVWQDFTYDDYEDDFNTACINLKRLFTAGTTEELNKFIDQFEQRIGTVDTETWAIIKNRFRKKVLMPVEVERKPETDKNDNKTNKRKNINRNEILTKKKQPDDTVIAIQKLLVMAKIVDDDIDIFRQQGMDYQCFKLINTASEDYSPTDEILCVGFNETGFEIRSKNNTEEIFTIAQYKLIITQMLSNRSVPKEVEAHDLRTAFAVRRYLRQHEIDDNGGRILDFIDQYCNEDTGEEEEEEERSEGSNDLVE